MAWVASLGNQEQVDQFDKRVRSFVLDDVGVKLLEILDRRLDAVEANEIDPSTYEDPSWACKQAHLNGYRQALLQIKKLFEFAGER